MQKKGIASHLQGASRLLDDVDGVQVSAALEAQYSVHCQLSKVVLVISKDLAAQGGPRNIEQVLPELLGIRRIVDGDSF